MTPLIYMGGGWGLVAQERFIAAVLNKG